MTDYTKLVAAVRDTDFGDTCVYCEHSDMCKASDCIIFQAADAIEALQAEVDKANKSVDAYRGMYFAKRGDITIEKVRELDEIDCHFHSALIRLMYKRIKELESEEKSRNENCEKCAEATRRVIIDLQGIIADLRAQLPKRDCETRKDVVRMGGRCRNERTETVSVLRGETNNPKVERWI